MSWAIAASSLSTPRVRTARRESCSMSESSTHWAGHRARLYVPGCNEATRISSRAAKDINASRGGQRVIPIQTHRHLPAENIQQHADAPGIIQTVDDAELFGK